MQEYQFGALLLWQTRFLEVPYRNFAQDYTPNMVFVPKRKQVGKPMKMVLDGQQRLQSFYVGLFGTYDGRRLHLSITGGPE